eukprot:6044137-Ditylum_brightwellii.AAC.1
MQGSQAILAWITPEKASYGPSSAGRWKSDELVEDHLENSKTQKKEQMQLLDAEPTKNNKNQKNLQPVRNPNLLVLSAIYSAIPQNHPLFP